MKALPAEVERYLEELCQHLSALPAEEREDIRAELAANFREQLEHGQSDLLASFPPPREYAAQFMAGESPPDDLAVGRIDPLRAVVALVVGGPLTLALATAGTVCLIVGIAKLFVGAKADLFFDDQGFAAFGIFDQLPGKPVFGWWGIPVFVLAGLGLALAAYVLQRRARRWVRRAR